MNAPLFSVIITTFNRAHLLPVAIQSVLDQNFKDFELIIVDDASTDDTESIVAKYDDSRIRYFKNVQNLYKGGARNAGIVNATGKYITFLDDDDHYLPEHIERISERIKEEHEPVALFYTNVVKLNGDVKEVIAPGNIPNGQDPVEFVFQPWTPIGAPQATVHRDILQELKFNPEIRIGQDTELFMRIAAKHPLFYVNTDTFVAITHEDNSGALKYNSGKERLEGYQFIFSNPELKGRISNRLKNKLYAYCYRRMSDHYEYIGDRKNTLRSAMKALYYSPFDKDLKIKMTQIVYNLPIIGSILSGIYKSLKGAKT